jgi:hypothetical protein
MSVIGESEIWRREMVDVYDLIHQTILRVWPECRRCLELYPPKAVRKRGAKKGRLNHPPEDPITRQLIVHLRRDKGVRERLVINSQVELLPSSSDVPVDPIGYLDISIEFFVGTDQVCLAVECKRLNVARATLAGPYVLEGMMRFVNGQYSPDLSLGGMIGYVMDGDVERAYAAVRGQIESQAILLLCNHADIIDAPRPHHFRSSHLRAPVPIELRHILLSMN